MTKIYTYFISRSARYYRNFFWIWLSLILLVSSIPDIPNPKVLVSGVEFRFDHIIHWFQYMALAFLMVSWQFKKVPSQFRKILLYTLLIGLVIAIGDEYHQLLIPGRSFTYADMLSNSLGVTSGVILAGLVWRSFFLKEHLQDPGNPGK